MDRHEARQRVADSLRGANAALLARRARVPCPLCEILTGKPDKKTSLSVEPATGLFYCWKCGSGGRLAEPPNPDAELSAPPVVASDEAANPPPGFVELGRGDGASAEATAEARRYLARRGITPALCTELGAGCVTSGYYNGRVVMPCRTPDGAWYGWVARAWFDGAQKPYLYPPGMPRGEYLFNHAALWTPTTEPLIVVEGVFDAVAVWPDGAAVLGKPGHRQMEALALARRPVCLVLDGDAHREAWVLALKLRFAGQSAGYVKLPPQIDPDEVDPSWLRDEARRSISRPL